MESEAPEEAVRAMAAGEPRVEVRPEAVLTADDWQRIRRLVDSVDWRRGGPPGPSYRYGAMSWRVLVLAADELVAHSGVDARTIAVGGQTVRTGAIGGVSTLPAWEGRGFATLALDSALAFVRDVLGAPFGMLTCRDHMVPFYVRRGWRMLTVPVTFEQPPDGTVRLARPFEAMVYRLGAEEWPAGDVDLKGPLV